jgi:signal transduction histidine kinase/ActR/RegA family two-component response regulator
MTVRKRLHLNTAASAITVLVVALVLSIGLYRINRAFGELDIADEILKGSFQRYTLLNDYLMNGNQRAREQWFSEHAAIGNTLSIASQRVQNSPDKKIIAEMIVDHEATAKLFTGIVENRESKSADRVPDELSAAIEQRHLTQLNIRLYDKILNIDALRFSARSRVFSELKRTGGAIVVFIIIAAALSAVGSWATGRFINRRISMLRRGSSIIGQGDLDHRIDIKGNDEFADFSQAFNAMTEKLRMSHRELRNEIADRKRAEEALQQLNETLEQQVSDRTELAEARSRQLQALAVELIEAEEKERRRIAQILHDDLQQMLAAAKMQLQTVSESLPDEWMLKNVCQILEQSIAKSRRLSHELSPAVLHHSGLVKGLEWLCGQMEERFGLKTALETGLDMPLESTPLRIFLFRAVQELLFNIVKHAGVKTARIEIAGSSGFLAINVSDAGRGFDPALIDKRPDKMGFGLLTIKERAKYIGGKLGIESSPGKGSRFALAIPMAMLDSGSTRQLTRAVPKPVRPPDLSTPPSVAGDTRVIFADDHQVMRQGLIQLVSKQPDIHVVGEASNGREAVEQARRLRPEVIVMDISMPEMNGIDATRIIKSEMPQIRVIGLSMHDDESISQAMREAGADAFISKTVGPADLLKAIYAPDREKRMQNLKT